MIEAIKTSFYFLRIKMKPKYPLTQPFDQLPRELPIYPIENALLPGGELPITIDGPDEISLFLHALRTDQMIGMIQPDKSSPNGIFSVGCAGRIRQYRERKDGRINVMLTGFCRYRAVEEIASGNNFRSVDADWSNYACDYEVATVPDEEIDLFKKKLADYFTRHQMQVDWEALNRPDIEELVNNLVLVMNLTIEDKQQLLESQTVQQRMVLFTKLLEGKATPIWTGGEGAAVN